MENERVDPNLVPKRKLYTGAVMPAIGLGTFGSDRASPDEVAAAVKGAVLAGYRHLDCASVYLNEDRIGAVLEELFHLGIRREELWITSKVWNDRHDDVIGSCRQSLADLRLDYLDMYLVHWPFPNFHPPGCSVDSRSPNAKPYIHESYMKTWRGMERLVGMGLTRHIGTSNMTIPKLKLVLRDAAIKPAANEMELLGSPLRPDRDRTPEDSVDIEDPVIVQIAQRLGVHPAVVCVKWAVQRGQTPIPFSIVPREYVGNLRCVTTPPLTDEEMRAIAGIDRNCRLIKGQVFLWKENQSWEDLWDLDGEIKA
jgi:alcohol dehydrogenase (NADP+)